MKPTVLDSPTSMSSATVTSINKNNNNNNNQDVATTTTTKTTSAQPPSPQQQPPPPPPKERTAAAKPLTFQEQVVANICALIDAAGAEGIRLFAIAQAYRVKYGRPLEFDRLGYNSATTFILDHVSTKDYRMVHASTFGDFTYYKRTPEEIDKENQEEMLKRQAASKKNEYDQDIINAHEQAYVEDEDTVEERKQRIAKLLKEMKTHCKAVLKDHMDERFTPTKFFDMFELELGWRPKPEDYGCSSVQTLLVELYRVGAVLMELDARHRLQIYLPSQKPRFILDGNSRTGTGTATGSTASPCGGGGGGGGGDAGEDKKKKKQKSATSTTSSQPPTAAAAARMFLSQKQRAEGNAWPGAEHGLNDEKEKAVR